MVAGIPRRQATSKARSRFVVHREVTSCWAVTGVGGFIGSHLLERLLRDGHRVVGLENWSAGRRSNLEEVARSVGDLNWSRFRLVEADLVDVAALREALHGCDYVLHHAALGSVPKSMEDPVATHASNVTGFLNVLEAARTRGVKRVVYASSSAVYGDSSVLPALEASIGQPLSPYALSKSANEQYAAVFRRCYGLEVVGLRYFNVFGARQDPAGAYAAVIPKWIAALLEGRDVEVYGDGSATRDFCHVANIVAANLLAATRPLPDDAPRVFNVGLGAGTPLTTLFEVLRREVARWRPATAAATLKRTTPRAGDILHSWADTTLLCRWLGFEPVRSVEDGLRETVDWFAAEHARALKDSIPRR